MPKHDRSQCVTCEGDRISLLGAECQPCSATQVVNSEHTKCEECPGGQVAANGVCACAAGFYHSTGTVIKCSDTCDIADEGGLSVQEPLVQLTPLSCSACPPCVRCPIGGNGLSSTALIRPGYGLPKNWNGTPLADLIADNSATKVTIYPCPTPEFCAGEHFEVDRKFVLPTNVDSLLDAEDAGDDEVWKKQLGNLAVGAGIRIEATNTLSESTLGSSLMDLNLEQITAILHLYYTQTELTETVTEYAGFNIIYPGREARVVVPDVAIAEVLARRAADVRGNKTHQTRFSCAVGHQHGGPLCAVCEHGFAGGSTSICKHCESSTTGIRVVVFVLALVLAWMVLVALPARLIKQAKDKMQSRQQAAQFHGLQLVGANSQRASAFVYVKIIVSHFQVR
jgi:hypothetical protein